MAYFKYSDKALKEEQSEKEMNAASEQFVKEYDQCDRCNGQKKKPMLFNKIIHSNEQLFHGYLLMQF
jgi:hypothetical protein